jgi:hypothetical protein
LPPVAPPRPRRDDTRIGDHGARAGRLARARVAPIDARGHVLGRSLRADAGSRVATAVGMRRLVVSGLLALLTMGRVATGSPAGATPEAAPAPREPAIELGVGVAGGGAPFLDTTDTMIHETSARATVVTSVRLRLPRLSPRMLELAAVWPHGIGLTIKNEDLRIGPARLHLLDVGVFYAIGAPVTVQRVDRRWDLTVGMSADIVVRGGLALTVDARLFSPLDLFSVVTRHGDSSRLIGEEILKGGQLWAGAAYRW